MDGVGGGPKVQQVLRGRAEAVPLWLPSCRPATWQWQIIQFFLPWKYAAEDLYEIHGMTPPQLRRISRRPVETMSQVFHDRLP
jgi:hypothetical protein